MQNDMTKGSPLRLIVFFTIPVLLGNIFQNVYNLMDSIIVGRFLGVNALNAYLPGLWLGHGYDGRLRHPSRPELRGGR